MGLFSRTESPVAKWPEMKILKRKGGVQLRGKYAWPGLDGLGIVLFVALVIAAMYYAASQGGGVVGAASVAAGLMIPAPFVWRSIVIRNLGRSLDVRILPDAVYVKRKRYDRSAVSGFRVDRHQKSRQEARLERNRRREQPRTYREALEVVMDYGEKRVPIAAMPDRDERLAEALVYRLQSIHQDLDRYVGGGKGPPGGGGGGSGGNGGDDFGPPPDIR